jgi:hypothetical protein
MNAQELIGIVLDGHADAATIAALDHAVRSDPEVRRLWTQHLIISEIASQELAPERSAEAFMDGLSQRHRASQDGAAFTATVMERIKSEHRRRARAVGSFAYEVIGVATAAAILIGLIGFAVHAISDNISVQPRIVKPTVGQNYRPIDVLSLLNTKELSRE